MFNSFIGHAVRVALSIFLSHVFQQCVTHLQFSVGHALRVLPAPFLSQVFQQRVTLFYIAKVVTHPQGA